MPLGWVGDVTLFEFGLACGLAFFFCGVSENPLVFDIPIP